MAALLGAIRPESSRIESDSKSYIELRDMLAEGPAPSTSPGPASITAIDAEAKPALSILQAALLISQLTLVELLTSFSNGLLTVGIPRMATDLSIPQTLIYWPISAYGLTSGACLLVAGAVADVLGSRPVNLVGNMLLGIFNIASGLSQTGEQLIAFRGLYGVATAMYLPSSVSVLTHAIPHGKVRNVGFASAGFAHCIGFALGLVIGGLFVQTVGWRVGYYICGAAQVALFCSGLWVLPKDEAQAGGIVWKKLATEIDWLGAGLASASLAMFAYVLAAITTDITKIKQPGNIVLLVVSILLVPAFVLWVARQERLSKPALIPNSIWANTAFTTTCIMILQANATLQAIELFSSLFFQQVQHLSALETSVRFLPAVILGAILNIVTGFVVHRVPAMQLIVFTTLGSAAAPLLMALIQPQWPYWYDAFPAQLLSPLGIDVLFTVGILIVSDVFPSRTQALAGAVFNTVVQFGNAIGVAIVAVISSAVTQESSYEDKTSPPALLEGYRAGFWAAFAWTVLSCAVGVYGLRKVGKVGLKRD